MFKKKEGGTYGQSGGRKAKRRIQRLDLEYKSGYRSLQGLWLLC